jgi:hypothetical protein
VAASGTAVSAVAVLLAPVSVVLVRFSGRIVMVALFVLVGDVVFVVAGIVLFVVVGVPLLGFASSVFIVAAVVLPVVACGALHVAANAGSTKMTAATR